MGSLYKRGDIWYVDARIGGRRMRRRVGPERKVAELYLERLRRKEEREDLGANPRGRVSIESVAPEIDGGRFPAKRIQGDTLTVSADAFGDGHDAIACRLLYRKSGARKWSEVQMAPEGNDRWRAAFKVDELGIYEYTVEAWIDHFETWKRDLIKRKEAGQVAHVDLLIGAALVERASGGIPKSASAELKRFASALEAGGALDERAAAALGEDLSALMTEYSPRDFSGRYAKELKVIVDREKARFSAWYEMFPRSAARANGAHGTLRDLEARLPYVAEMGFDVLYLPPIHPIGRTFRKGKNNSANCGPDDPGSPWAIGSEEGGHKAIHPQLGTLEDFRSLVARAQEFGIEVALDIAFQCSPDHPYVKEHPEWFKRRPDGTIQYAENPPKKYQDIYPFDFDTEAWQALWDELKSVVLYWAAEGVTIFRVDNPHTKPFSFWAWLIREVKNEYPGAIFLAEAFTRPKVMYRLAKLGFTQSYNYFPWRNMKREITEYMTELTQTAVREYFTGHFWPNTPDILTEYLQHGGRPAHMTRLVLAAALSSSYGIYGPAFELFENAPLEEGKEEYLHSEKYEIRAWPREREDSLKDFISVVNRARRQHPALQRTDNIRFHAVDNEQLICFSKANEDFSDTVIVVVNLDPFHTHSGWVDLDLAGLRIAPEAPYQVNDVLTGARYTWQGKHNFIELNPHVVPAHIFIVRRKVRSEYDFDYFA